MSRNPYLSPKEIEIIELLCNDKHVKEIAEILDKSIHTINMQIKTAKTKLGVGTAKGLVGKYLQLKFENNKI